jgi:hypothetical protein
MGTGITNALCVGSFTHSVVTGGFTGSGSASVTASWSGNTMRVTAVSSGLITVGQSLFGNGIRTDTTVTALLQGGIGTYTVSISQTISSTTSFRVMSGPHLQTIVSATVAGTTMTVSAITGSADDGRQSNMVTKKLKINYFTPNLSQLNPKMYPQIILPKLSQLNPKIYPRSRSAMSSSPQMEGIRACLS